MSAACGCLSFILQTVLASMQAGCQRDLVSKGSELHFPIAQSGSVSLWLPGAGGEVQKRLVNQVQMLWGAVSQRSILLPAVFVFLWQVRHACAVADHGMLTETMQIGIKQNQSEI